MDTNNHQDTKSRIPLVALLLSLGATGLGHIYCGKLAKGLVLFFISFAFAPVIVLSTKYTSSTFTLIMVLLSLVVILSVFFYGIIDSWRIAKKTGRVYKPRDYNKWYIYLLFIIVSLSYPTNLTNSIVENVLQAYRIAGASMHPNILKNDYVFLNKLAYLNSSPKRGEVVIFIHPNKRHISYVKRIVAMPGDTLQVINNILYINHKPLVSDSRQISNLNPVNPHPGGLVLEENNYGVTYKILLNAEDSSSLNYPETIVPNGYCFVMGDNRNHCLDSRNFGPIPLRDVKGRTDFVYLPAENWSRFGKM